MRAWNDFQEISNTQRRESSQWPEESVQNLYSSLEYRDKTWEMPPSHKETDLPKVWIPQTSLAIPWIPLVVAYQRYAVG